MSMERLGLWPLRGLWLIVPLVAGPAMADLLDGRSDRVATVAEVGLWAGWFVVLVGLLAPSTVALTVVRILVPSGLGALCLAAVVDGQLPATTVAAGLVLAVVTIVTFLPWTGDVMINGSAYGSERRMALRPPAALLLGPLVVVWLVVFAGLVTGPLLLANERWVAGAAATVLGAVLVWLGGRSLHQLARRWIVFVPAGFVIHDYSLLAESILLKRSDIATLGPAPVDPGEVVDLSAGARGLALLVQLTAATPLARRSRRDISTTTTSRLLFTPSLPGAVLQEARVRGVKIGSPVTTG